MEEPVTIPNMTINDVVDEYGNLMMQKKILDQLIEEAKQQLIEHQQKEEIVLLSGTTGFIEWGNPYRRKTLKPERLIEKGYVTEEQLEECREEGKEQRNMKFKPYQRPEDSQEVEE